MRGTRFGFDYPLLNQLVKQLIVAFRLPVDQLL